LGGFYIYCNMKLLKTIKNIILEEKQLLDRYEFGGLNVDIFYNDHSNMAISNSLYGRQSIEIINESIVEILDIVIEVSIDILNSPSKIQDKDRSILIKDYMIGVDYHVWVTQSKNGDLFLTINTSIGHPKNLPNDQNDKTIIITKSGDTIIKEQFGNNNFTKIVKGDIILYII
jgi:hypothetical protein